GDFRRRPASLSPMAHFTTLLNGCGPLPSRFTKRPPASRRNRDASSDARVIGNEVAAGMGGIEPAFGDSSKRPRDQAPARPERRPAHSRAAVSAGAITELAPTIQVKA